MPDNRGGLSTISLWLVRALSITVVPSVGILFVALIFIATMPIFTAAKSLFAGNGTVEEFCGYDCGCLGAIPRESLAVGETFKLSVNAGDPWNAIGLTFDKGGVYQFEIGSISWEDDSKGATENGWKEDVPFYVETTRPFWREPSQPLFRLIGTVHARCEGGYLCAEIFPIRGRDGEKEYRAQRSGAFCAFANDLPNMYGNNSGELTLNVKRTK